MGIWYTTREDVKSAQDFKETARNNAQLDRAIEAASRSVEALTHRKFYPQIDTRYFDWPNAGSGTSYRLWLDEDELVSVSSLVAAGVTIAASDYNLEPANDGPPYTYVDLIRSSSATFGGAETFQRAIAIAGTYAGTEPVVEATTLLNGAINSSVATLDVDDSSLVGVGSLLKIDSEYVQVIAKTMKDTTQDASALTEEMNSVSFTVAPGGGATLAVDELILIDSERMRIVDIAGDTITVLRAEDGSTLAAHNASSSIYAARTCAVLRARCGTTAASHLDNAPISRLVFPALISELTAAEALNIMAQRSSGYARTVGAGDNEREAGGRGIKALREDVYYAHGRVCRMGAV